MSDFDEEDDDWDLAPEIAHPKAVEALKEDFFWDICDDLSPFGNDDGWDTMASYRDWRFDNPNENVKNFLDEFLDGWDVKNENWNLQNEEEIKAEMQADEFSFLTRDKVIISLAFAQFVFDGKIDYEVKNKAIWAIERQQNEWLIHATLSEKFREEWKSKLKVMEKILKEFDNDGN